MDCIIIGILAAIVVFAIFRAKKHFSGGCCGSAGNTIRDKKELAGEIIGEKLLIIEGMHCANCEIRVENALNRLDDVIAVVSWKKKQAAVSYSVDPGDEVLKETVEKLGYTVTEIR